MPSPRIPVLVLLLSTISLFAQTPAKRTLNPDDIYRLQQVHDEHVSPDGRWIVYTVSSMDRDSDKRNTAIWMVNWEGTEDIQLTRGPESASSPRWSPDGKYLAFKGKRGAEEKSQIWLLDRRGGEPFAATNVKDDIGEYEWSPDGKRIVLSMSTDEDAADGKDKEKDKKVAKPIVIDRYHFKRDIEGYLTASSLGHLYLLDVESKKLDKLTDETAFDEDHAKWSPDGTQIAYVSNHAKDPDRTGTTDIFLVDAKPASKPNKLLTTYEGREQLIWTPDGKRVAFFQGLEPKYNAYNQSRLAMVSVKGGDPTELTAKLDRSVSQVEFTPDGSIITFLFEDDRHEYLAKMPAAGGNIERITGNDNVILERDTAGSHSAVVAANDTTPAEVYALENGNLRKLTKHNDDFLSGIQLGAVEDINFKSKDGTEVHGVMTKPPNFEAGKKYPTLLWIHGGPNMQDDHALRLDLYPLALERQMFAAHGYVVLAINYRGGSGRGSAYTQAILADWGNKEVADLLAGVDYVVQKGIADPQRLGVGGWSYGGILTDYVIASDPRFKAAISGAGSALQLSMYGSDQYIVQYDNEMLPPWKSPDTWIKVSYPFFHADRIHTPTMFVGGQSDFNVPIIGSEQMYQALRSLNVPTELVIYPTQFHIFTRPSYIRDRMGRYLDWWDKYLKQ